MAVDPRALLLQQLTGGGGGGGAPPAAPPGLPPELMAAMAGGGAPLAGPEPGAPDLGGPMNAPTDDPLAATQQVIQDLHALIGVLPDPSHTKVASQCLTALTGIQRDLMRPEGAGGGGGGAPPPGYGG